MGKLHPKVKEFKAFIEKHPKLIKHVRKNEESWQPYYEKWSLYGEDDDYWNQFKDEQDHHSKSNSKSKQTNQEIFNKISSLVNNLDLNKVQEQMTQLNGVISNVQSLLQQFQQNKQQNLYQRPPQGPNPFKFGKD